MMASLDGWREMYKGFHIPYETPLSSPLPRVQQTVPTTSTLPNQIKLLPSITLYSNTMRNALTALLLTAPAVLSLPKPFPAATPRNYGSWDISTTYMNVPSSAFWRNVTAVYTNSEESLHLITECKQQGGPGNEEINECDNADFKWTLEGDAGKCN